MSMDSVMATTEITRSIPCELMKQYWNIKDDVDYCLNSINCQLDLLTNKKQNTRLCFNFSKGVRTLHQPKRKMRQKHFSFKSVWLSTCK